MSRRSRCCVFSLYLSSLWTCCWKLAIRNIHLRRRPMQLGPDWRLSLSSYLPFFRGAISTRSSISDSKSPALVYAKALVGICAVLLLGLEILSIYLEKHYSATYTRVSRQYSEALEVRPSSPGEAASLLMVGNSLLLAGIDL